MTLKITELEDAFLFVGAGYKGESFAFINRETGDCYFLSDVIDVEDQELPDGYETRGDFGGDARFVSVPHKSDLELGRRLVFDFARGFMPEHEDKIHNIFLNKGAYRSYRRFLEAENCLDEWHKFENEQTLAKLREWCAENGIELSD